MHTEAEAPTTEPLSLHDSGIVLRGVGRRFGRLVALEGLDLELRPREVLAVVGPSGCGKSTLLELVAGLQEPDAGTVLAAGESHPAGRRAACAYMPQRRRAEPLFDRFGLREFERSRPAELSGGMRQRVAFLRTLLLGRPILLLDEPFGALDAITRASMHEWLAGALLAEPCSVLLVTHDVEEAVFLADRVAVMSPRPGRIVETLEVDLPRPRRLTDARLVELRAAALEALAG
jgi:NitT/TauT family transport system ATP-binding protein